MAKRKAGSGHLLADMKRRASEGEVHGLITKKGRELVVVIERPEARVFNISGLEPIARGPFRFQTLDGVATLSVTGSKNQWRSEEISGHFLLVNGSLVTI